MSPVLPKGRVPPGHQRQEIQGVSSVGWVWCPVRCTHVALGMLVGLAGPQCSWIWALPQQSQMYFWLEVTWSGNHLEGMQSRLSPPTVSGRKGGYCGGIQALGGEAILEERCRRGWVGYVCSTGNTETSWASSAGKVSGECQKRLLLALGQLGTRRIFFKCHQSVTSSLEKVSRNPCPFGTCPKIILLPIWPGPTFST